VAQQERIRNTSTSYFPAISCESRIIDRESSIARDQAIAAAFVCKDHVR
jgi:hypothetical protein